jgi:Ca2+-binding EF-hand superfamily protein
MIRKALLFTALATVIGASTGAVTTAFAAGQGGAGSGQSKAAMFDKCDKNGDGSLTADEFKACHRDSARAEKKFKRLDTNHDGTVSREEIQSAHTQKKGSYGTPGGAAAPGAGQHGG